METLTNGIEVARKVFGQAAFEGMVDKEVFPGKDNKEVRVFCWRTYGNILPQRCLIIPFPRFCRASFSTISVKECRYLIHVLMHHLDLILCCCTCRYV